ncbi:MAG: sulfatase-like hydrolase/transferase, partial [Deltaproteobacteria bacterium]
MMKKRLLSLLMVFCCSSCFAAKSSGRPNILFIMADDHTREGISAYGSWLKDYCKTPNIDRLAKEGMLFTNTYCNNSICSPSRASILTGQYSHINGVTKLRGTLRPGVPMFTKELQKAGYTTALVGKWHLMNDPEGYDYHVRVLDQGTYFNPKLIGSETLSPQGYSADVFTDIAL